MKRQASIAVGLGLLLVCAAVVWAKSSTDRLTPENRLSIVREVVYEYATLRQPLPRAKKERQGLHVSHQGEVDEAALRQAIAERGPALLPGEIIQITRIRFKRDYILFEINGGGKKKRKWWQRVRVQGGVGSPTENGPPPTVPNPPPPPPPGSEGKDATGSWILLTFPSQVPDLGPEDVKEMLAQVLNFSTKSATKPWIETIPEEFREAIKENKAVVGMDRKMVLAALGQPTRKVREVKEGREEEDWIYGNPPFVTFVTFVDDQVVEVKEYR
ncbi:MAG: hypothetical protein ACE5IP_09035 [Terriglobia bacterium]